MKPFPHTYHVELAGGPSGHARLSAEHFPDLSTAPPVEFDGPGDAWTPEHLFLASVQTCFLFTLRAVARASKVEFLSIDVGATGTVDRRDGVTRFTEIVIHPRLVIPAGTDRERALQAIEKSEKHCLVTASLSTPVRLETAILQAAEARLVV